MRWRVLEASFHMAQPITVAAMRTCFVPHLFELYRSLTAAQ